MKPVNAIFALLLAYGQTFGQTYPAPGPSSRAPTGGTPVVIVNRAVGSGDGASSTVATAAMDCTGSGGANTIVAIVESSTDVVTSIDDNVNSGYTRGAQADSNITDHIIIGWFVSATPSAAQVVTATFASPSTFRRIRAWCTKNPTSALDGTSVGANSTTGLTATTAALTPSVSNGIIISGAANNDGGATWTANNGFSTTVVGATDTQGLEKLSSSGATTPSATMTVSGGAWRIVAGAFK